MEEKAQEALLTHLLAVLREGVDGPVGEFAYFSDAGPTSGLRGLLDTVTFEMASQEIGGNSIAAQVHHLTLALNASAQWLRGERTRPDWATSWTVGDVSAESWGALRQELFSAFEACYHAIETSAFDTEMNAGLSLGTMAHLTYHLGAIRQKCLMLG